MLILLIISNTCIHGFRCKAIKKSWKLSSDQCFQIQKRMKNSRTVFSKKKRCSRAGGTFSNNVGTRLCDWRNLSPWLEIGLMYYLYQKFLQYNYARAGPFISDCTISSRKTRLDTYLLWYLFEFCAIHTFFSSSNLSTKRRLSNVFFSYRIPAYY